MKHIIIVKIKSTLSQDLFRIMVSEIQKSRGIAVDESVINVKGKSFDHLGIIGDGTASACIALVSVNNA